MEIETIVSDLLKSNMYVIKENGRCILIDPCVTSHNFENVDYILLTHEHYDHISGVNYWKNRTNASVVASNKCAIECQNSRKNLSRYFEAFCQLQTWITGCDIVGSTDYTCDVDITFEGEMVLEWEKHKIVMKECPGHSPGSIIIIIDDNMVFSGDSIMKDYEVECGFPGGSKEIWISHGMRVVNSLPIDSMIYPGHFAEFRNIERIEKNKGN